MHQQSRQQVHLTDLSCDNSNTHGDSYDHSTKRRVLITWLSSHLRTHMVMCQTWTQMISLRDKVSQNLDRTPGGGGGGGGTPGGGGMPRGTPPSRHAMLGTPLAAPIPQNGGLWGTPPQIYTGDCSHTDLFTNEFLLYKNLNRHHEVMSVPYNQVLMALTFMKGPKIDNWARVAGWALNEQINQEWPKTDEGL